MYKCGFKGQQMKINKQNESRRKADRSNFGSSRYDPLQAVREQSGDFDKGWLKNGESMPPIQRVSYAIVSLAFIFIGIFTEGAFWEDFLSRDATCLFWGFATLFLVSLGCLGLRNVLRFRRA
jgi:hypothetical protein